MRIVIAFVGGGMDGRTIAGDSHNTEAASLNVMNLYLHCQNGTEGSKFTVPARRGKDVYEVCRKLVNGDSIIIRARHVAFELDPSELKEIRMRR